jgi:endoglucanase Acf2
MDVRVSAYYDDDYVRVINNVDSGFNTASTIGGKAGVSKVYIKVTGNSASATGNFSITYTTANTRPKVPWPAGLPASPTDITSNSGTWINGSIAVAGSEVWYSLDVTDGTRYYIWWNDSYQGDSTKTVDVRLSAYYDDDYVRVINNVDSGYNTASTIDGKAGVSKVYIKVYANNASATGTYSIAYTTVNTRP